MAENTEKKTYSRGMSYTIYKGVRGKFGAFRLSPSFPMTDIPMKDREGFVMVEMAAAKGPNQYDWDNKVMFKLSVMDMSRICMFLRNPTKKYSFCESNEDKGTKYNSLTIMHDTSKASGYSGVETKFLKFSKSSDRHNIMVNMTHKKDSDTNYISVTLSQEECYVIVQLLDKAFGKILSW